ncbi:MAG: hypothetical protein ACK5CW_05850 [Verrucomicrobiota bacterium]|jgi:hypothetical protein
MKPVVSLIAAAGLLLTGCRVPTERVDVGAAPDALTKNTLDARSPAVSRPDLPADGSLPGMTDPIQPVVIERPNDAAPE